MYTSLYDMEDDVREFTADEVLVNALAARQRSRTDQEAVEVLQDPDALVSRVRQLLSGARVGFMQIAPHGLIGRLINAGHCPVACQDKLMDAARPLRLLLDLLQQPYIVDLPSNVMMVIAREVRQVIPQCEIVFSQHREIDVGAKHYIWNTSTSLTRLIDALEVRGQYTSRATTAHTVSH